MRPQPTPSYHSEWERERQSEWHMWRRKRRKFPRQKESEQPGLKERQGWGGMWVGPHYRKQNTAASLTHSLTHTHTLWRQQRIQPNTIWCPLKKKQETNGRWGIRSCLSYHRSAHHYKQKPTWCVRGFAGTCMSTSPQPPPLHYPAVQLLSTNAQNDKAETLSYVLFLWAFYCRASPSTWVWLVHGKETEYAWMCLNTSLWNQSCI